MFNALAYKGADSLDYKYMKTQKLTFADRQISESDR